MNTINNQETTRLLMKTIHYQRSTKGYPIQAFRTQGFWWQWSFSANLCRNQRHSLWCVKEARDVWSWSWVQLLCWKGCLNGIVWLIGSLTWATCICSFCFFRPLANLHSNSKTASLTTAVWMKRRWRHWTTGMLSLKRDTILSAKSWMSSDLCH